MDGQLIGLWPHILRKGNRRNAVQRRFDGGADSARIQHIFPCIIAAIDPRQHQVRLFAAHHLIDAHQNAIGGAAFDGIAFGAKFGNHHRMGIADAMTHARLFKGGGDDGDLARRPRQKMGHLCQHVQTFGGDAIVIGDQNPHHAPWCSRPLLPSFYATHRCGASEQWSSKA